jgi:hypothetical protein
VRQRVHAREAEVLAQRFDVGDLPVAAVRRGGGRHRGVPGAAQIQQHQLPVRAQSAQVAEAAIFTGARHSQQWTYAQSARERMGAVSGNQPLARRRDGLDY